MNRVLEYLSVINLQFLIDVIPLSEVKFTLEGSFFVLNTISIKERIGLCGKQKKDLIVKNIKL